MRRNVEFSDVMDWLTHDIGVDRKVGDIKKEEIDLFVAYLNNYVVKGV